MIRLPIALLLATALLAGPALAQEATPAPAAEPAKDGPPRLLNGTRIGAWTVTCEAIAVGETNCVLSQRLVRASDDAFLVELLGFWSGDLKTSFLAARVPMGAYLPSGVVIGTTEAEDQIKLAWQACGPQLCEALIELDAATRTRLDKAGEATIGYRPGVQAEPLIFKVGTTGLNEALDSLHAALGG